MFSGVRPLTDVALWARSNGLEIVLLVTGAILLARLVTWPGGRITDRIDANAKWSRPEVFRGLIRRPAGW